MFSNPSRRSQRGFTLVEVIVMSAVATIGVLATLVVANVTLQASDTNEKRVAATNLAREGLELVRAARDSNWAAYSRQQDAGVSNPNQLQPWDCYAGLGNAATVTLGTLKPACDGRFGGTSSAPANTPVNYVAYPTVGNGVPYFVVPTATDANTTKTNTYLICQGQGANPPVYTPTVAAASGNPCGANGGQPFYRRVTVKRGKALPGGPCLPISPTYNLLVRSYVTWPDRRGDDVLIEEYLTNWRKFPCP